METFERLIRVLPKDARVLDVGCWGHEGVNTSKFLAEYFDHVTGMAISEKVKKHCPENYTFIQDNFYDHRFGEVYDLVVTDLTIESNMLNDWSNAGIERISKLVAPGGFWMNFVMMTDQYGDPEVTPDLIRWHSKRWWGSDVPNPESVGKKLTSLKDFGLYAAEPEQRRPYILWCLLRKTDGSWSKTEGLSSLNPDNTKPTPSSSTESSSLNSTTTTKASSPSKTKKAKTK